MARGGGPKEFEHLIAGGVLSLTDAIISLERRFDRLEGVMDRLAMQQEQLRRDHTFLWRWADETAAQLRFFRPQFPEDRPEVLRPFQALIDRIATLELWEAGKLNRLEEIERGLGELAHEQERIAAALREELLCRERSPRP